MKTDAELLREYLEDHSEGAFAALVERHAGLVYSAALRQACGDTHLAEDVTQAVFTALVRKGRALLGHPSFSGWLYTAVRFAARDALRRNQRRQQRDQAYTMKALADRDPEEGDWTKLAPVLDQGMHALGEKDRQAILLRFFEGKKLAEIAELTGLNESAARKRVERAIEKLRRILLRHGIPLSASSLAAALECHAVALLPAGLAARVAAAAAAASSASLPFLTTMILTKTKIATVVAAAVLGGAWVHESKTNRSLREDNRALRDQIARRDAAPPPLPAPPDEALAPAEKSELLRLRGDVGLLRSQLAESRAAAARTAQPRAVRADEGNEDDPEKQDGIRRMQGAQQLMLAFYKFADLNGGAMPTNFAQITALLTQGGLDAQALQDLTNRFEIRPGAFSEIESPARGIVMREKEATPAPDGGWLRVYAFADGHSEVHKSNDGDFSAWEDRLGSSWK